MPLLWWPLGDHDLASVVNRTAPVLDAWSNAWFAADRFVLTEGICHAPQKLPELAARIWYQSEAIAIGLTEGSAALVDRALDFTPQRPRLAPDEMTLLDKFEHALVSELLAGIAERLGLPQAARAERNQAFVPTNPLGALTFEIVDERAEQAAIVMLQFEALKNTRHFASPVHAPARLARIEALLEEPTVRLCAQIGSATIRLEEMLHLSAGDVVLLDRKLDAGIDVLEQRSKMPIASAMLYRDDGAFVLQLNEKS